ncbi:MAG: ATP-binding cassette domain-containing protein [Nitrosopumilus sp.]|nr:ATP-binding cassette domain-containing protein [Nitrosopumilus sp.]MDA7958485.1 ATP-binding cassette domain-containing protein [Nitrosopumilus sp.]
MHAIETESLTKSFGGENAVDGITMRVEDGEIFGFLGPNGAGKSTTMMMLTTLLRPTSGRAMVAGFDAARDPKSVRRHIGYVQQDITADEYLTGRENLVLQSRLCHMEKHEAARRIDEVLSLVELEDRQNDPVVSYSGGMRKRLDIAGGLLNSPRVLFLDEPTVGLDIQTRTRLWGYIKRTHSEAGTSVFLTTHYMEEADRLCDRVAIIDSGSIRASGSPSELKEGLGGGSISVSAGSRSEGFLTELGSLGEVSGDGLEVRIRVRDGTAAMPKVFEAAARHGVRLESASLERPTLDDVFISHTGRGMRDAGFNRRREHARMRRIRA